MDDLVKEFKDAIEDPNVNHKIFKKAFVTTPTWDDMQGYIEFSKTAGNYRSDYEGFYILHCKEHHDISHMKGTKEFLEFMGKVYDKVPATQDCFTFVISENYRALTDLSGIKKHTDTTDTIHWTTVGATIWTLYQDGQAHEYLVEPGDIVFIKYGTEHGVESLTPRAGIVYSGGEYHPNKD
jgi:mannose-6-phosphate isomerase-like protein (cupin superfamily)